MPASRRTVVAIVAATLVVASLVLIEIRISGFVQRTRDHQDTSACQDHLRAIGGALRAEVRRDGAFPAHGGAPLLVALRLSHGVRDGRPLPLICPTDPDADPEATDSAPSPYATVDATDAAALAPLCSYAVRDLARYPIDDDGTDPETGKPAWLACDRQGRDGRTPHHESGLNVLFADGAVQFRDRASLGIPDGEPIVVGPGSTHPELRRMVFLPDHAGSDAR